MRKPISIALLLILQTAIFMRGNGVAFAATAAAGTSPAGHHLITLQNSILKVVLDLDIGARVVEYDYAPFKQNVVYETGSGGGMLMDHVWEQNWPGEFLGRQYEGEILQAGPDNAVVRVWSTGTGDTIKGLRIERTITLTGNSRVLQCRVAFSNPTDQGRVTGYWSQNNFYFDGAKDSVTWYRPTMRGVETMRPEEWNWTVNDPTAGWSGTASDQLPGGILFLMDYNDLWHLYDNGIAITTEWFYDKVAIPAGKTWTTDIYVIPSKGNHGYKFGSKNLAANFVVQEQPGGLQITHELTQGLQPLKDVTVKTKAWGLKTEWTAEAETKLAQIDESVAILPVTLAGTGAMPAGIQVTITGTTPDGTSVTETYGDFHGGNFGVNNDAFSMQPILKFDRPAKQKVFLKPDVIKYTPNAIPHILYLRGIWHEKFKIDDALTADFPNAKIDSGWLRSSPVGLGLSMFPADYPSLLSYDLIVLGNIPAEPVGLVGQEMLSDYLHAGGNVLILGGDRAYGQGDFTNPSLLAQMPVEFGGKYNWNKIPGGGVIATASGNPVLAGVSFGPRDMVFYSHLCVPRAAASVVATAGDRPLLVLGSTPAGGRVACVLATPFGVAGPGQTAFWDSAAWSKLMQNTSRWLVRHN